MVYIMQKWTLHHTDVFKETEKKAQIRTSLLPQQKVLDSDRKEIEQLEEKVELENVLPICITEEESQANETHEDLESYEPWDFNVQVISASESEDEPIQDQNPDLELLCESDQEVQDNADTENNAAEERFDCPECYRWFSSASSLRVHRMWHVYTCDTCGYEASEGLEKNNLTCSECGKSFSRLSALVSHQLHHPKQKQFQCPGCMTSYLHACADLRLRKGVVGSLHSFNGRPRTSVKVACPVC
uniref:C2H2-type domain-containing protein n=1 Tax=Anabas testudineus TaxID=64144 RepID=A0A7N6FB93_ANATE